MLGLRIRLKSGLPVFYSLLKEHSRNLVDQLQSRPENFHCDLCLNTRVSRMSFEKQPEVRLSCL